MPAHEIRLSADDCDIVLLGLERLLAHWHDHPEAARMAGVDIRRVQETCAAIADRGLTIPKEDSRGD